jgi:hypothetical protein
MGYTSHVVKSVNLIENRHAILDFTKLNVDTVFSLKHLCRYNFPKEFYKIMYIYIYIYIHINVYLRNHMGFIILMILLNSIYY